MDKKSGHFLGIMNFYSEKQSKLIGFYSENVDLNAEIIKERHNEGDLSDETTLAVTPSESVPIVL